MQQTLVLNADYTYLNTVSWRRALNLLIKDKAEVVKEMDRSISNIDGKYTYKVPLIVRLFSMVKSIYNNKVPYSKRNVLVRDNNECQYCGARGNLTIDHVIPSSRGGRSTFENCVASCISCNSKKGDRTVTEARMPLKRRPYEPTVVEFIMYKVRNTNIKDYLKEIGI